MREILNNAKMALALAMVIALVGGFTYAMTNSAVEWWAHRDEPVYLVSRAYDPAWKYAGFVPHAVTCYSPARCEPSGKPLLRYFTLLKEYQLREWGLNPEHETPYNGIL